MKNSRTIILSALLGISVLSGCTDKILFGDSFLEKQPGVDITQDTIFSRREFARRFLWTAYSKMYYALPVDWSAVGGKMNMGIFEVLSDCWHSHLNWDYVNTLYLRITPAGKTNVIIPALVLLKKTVGKQSGHHGCLLRMSTVFLICRQKRNCD